MLQTSQTAGLYHQRAFELTEMQRGCCFPDDLRTVTQESQSSCSRLLVNPFLTFPPQWARIGGGGNSSSGSDSHLEELLLPFSEL